MARSSRIAAGNDHVGGSHSGQATKQQASPKPEAVTASPSFAAAAATAFALVAFDVNSPWSLHLLAGPDMGIHTWVAANTSAEFRSTVADIYISDIVMAFSLPACMAGAAALLSQRPASGLQRLAVGIPLYIGGGSIFFIDPLLVDFLKKFFHRIRPSTDLHHSFSFPSGHTNGAVFLLGFLLFGILTPLLKSQNQDEPAGESAPNVTQNAMLAIWAAGGLITASGRMLADVHWLSDTMAGASLGALLVSLGTMAIHQLELRMPSAGSGSELGMPQAGSGSGSSEEPEDGPASPVLVKSSLAREKAFNKE